MLDALRRALQLAEPSREHLERKRGITGGYHGSHLAHDLLYGMPVFTVPMLGPVVKVIH